jgi:hypothetical protein
LAKKKKTLEDEVQGLLGEMAGDSKALAEQPPAEEDLETLNLLVQEILDLEQGIEEHQNAINLASLRLKQVQEELIPEIMTRTRMKILGMEDGSALEIKDEVYASIPKDRTNEAFKWLREHKFGDLIKNTLTIRFGKGQDKLVKGIVTFVTKSGLSPDRKEEVHHQTLKAWVKERLEAGEIIPKDLFGVYEQKKAVLKKAKSAAKKVSRV